MLERSMSQEESQLWKKFKFHSQMKRASNEEKSKQILVDKGIDFIEKPNGQVIIGDWNLWTTTGKFFNPKTGKKGRGIFNLLKKLNQ